jgi:hypothetical protein
LMAALSNSAEPREAAECDMNRSLNLVRHARFNERYDPADRVAARVVGVF